MSNQDSKVDASDVNESARLREEGNTFYRQGKLMKGRFYFTRTMKCIFTKYHSVSEVPSCKEVRTKRWSPFEKSLGSSV